MPGCQCGLCAPNAGAGKSWRMPVEAHAQWTQHSPMECVTYAAMMRRGARTLVDRRSSTDARKPVGCSAVRGVVWVVGHHALESWVTEEVLAVWAAELGLRAAGEADVHCTCAAADDVPGRGMLVRSGNLRTILLSTGSWHHASAGKALCIEQHSNDAVQRPCKCASEHCLQTTVWACHEMDTVAACSLPWQWHILDT